MSEATTETTNKRKEEFPVNSLRFSEKLINGFRERLNKLAAKKAKERDTNPQSFRVNYNDVKNAFYELIPSMREPE